MTRINELKENIRLQKEEIKLLRSRDYNKDVTEWLELRENVTSSEVAEVFGIDPRKAGRILKAIGYKCVIVRISGKSARIYKKVHLS